MKRVSIAFTVAMATLASSAMASDVGVSVTIGEPGFYGRIDIGNYPYPRPEVFYAEPRVIYRSAIVREPIYLRVPPGHRKNWSKHCKKYDACGEPVLFVRDSWYEREYVPYYQKHHRDHR